jgi:hypothetical protein
MRFERGTLYIAAELKRCSDSDEWEFENLDIIAAPLITSDVDKWLEEEEQIRSILSDSETVRKRR